MTFDQARRRGRRGLLLVAALCILPPLAAVLLYFVFPQWIPLSRVNHGRLIDPARPLPKIQLFDVGGNVFGAPLPGRRWRLMIFGGQSCDTACTQRVRLVRNLRKVLRQDSQRVVVLYLAPDILALRRASAVLGAATDGFEAATPAPGNERVLAKFFGADDVPGAVVIVDPLGNWVLSYPPDAPPKAIYLDLKRLLRYSQIG